jgi:cell division protein ZapE
MTISSDNTDPRSSYQYALDTGVLQPDQRQLEIVEKLQDLHNRLMRREQQLSDRRREKSGFLSSIFGKSGKQEVLSEPGLYLWGGVGRGKTLLCDMFFDSLPIAEKRRVHFHRFMRSVHDQLAVIKNVESPLELVADQVAADCRVLVLDEMHVNDITDAMLMGGLLQALFSRGVTLVTTSNAEPDNLYKDGLQRSRFIPAIESIKRHTEVVFLGGDIDYRLRVLENAEIYHTPLDDKADQSLESYFRQMVAAGTCEKNQSINVNGRQIETVLLADDVVWFTFDSLCATSRSTDDYIELARVFHTVLVSGVVVMDGKTDDIGRRFINLVDEFYDRNVKLVLTAEVSPEQLYTGNRLSFEFDRTVSRLREMQSTEYLASQHRP